MVGSVGLWVGATTDRTDPRTHRPTDPRTHGPTTLQPAASKVMRFSSHVVHIVIGAGIRLMGAFLACFLLSVHGTRDYH